MAGHVGLLRAGVVDQMRRAGRAGGEDPHDPRAQRVGQQSHHIRIT
jgi:hypothetical protein